MKVLALVILAAALLAAGPARAEKGQWAASLSPGFAGPVSPGGDFARENGNSLHILAGIDYEVEDGYWYGLEFGYAGSLKFHGKLMGQDLDRDGKEDTVVFTSDMDTKLLEVAPVLKVGGSYTDDLRYQFVVGPGFYAFFRGAGSAILEGTTTNGTSVNGQTMPFARSVNSFLGLDAGHTLSYEVNSSFQIGMDVRYHLIFMPGGATGIVVPGFRFTFLF